MTTERGTTAGRGPITRALVALAVGAPLITACAEDAAPVAPVRPPSASASLAAVPQGGSIRELSDSLVRAGIRDFAALPDALLWQFIAASDSVATVGVKRPGTRRGVERGKPVVSAADWEAGRLDVSRTPDVRLLRADTVMPSMQVKIDGVQALRRIRANPFVDYVEPARVVDMRVQDSGCGEERFTGYWSYTPSGDILPNTYKWMRIDRAWELSPGGRGVVVGLTDTGVDGAQDELGNGFASGQSAGRRIIFDSDQFFPSCSHGTRLAGVIAAPMNGRNVVGIAWAADLFTYKNGDGIVVSGGAGAEGIWRSGWAGARVINMSWGSGLRYSSIIDAIQHWHYFYGVLFVGAAGAATIDYLCGSSNTLFPAELPEVLAVSPTNHDGTMPCSASSGSAVDLTAFHMQPTTGRYGWGTTPVSVAQSSNAAAVVSGIGALVRARNPNLTVSQVMHRLTSTSGNRCGYLNNSNTHWRNIMVNAYAAVGGLCVAPPSGATSYLITYAEQWKAGTYCANVPMNGSGSYSYYWPGGSPNNERCATYKFYLRGDLKNYQVGISVRVTDNVTGSSESNNIDVWVRYSTAGDGPCPAGQNCMQ